MIKEELLAKIANFLKKYEMSPTRFSRLCVGNPSFYANLRNGCDIRLSTHDRVLKFMNDYTPAKPEKKEGE